MDREPGSPRLVEALTKSGVADVSGMVRYLKAGMGIEGAEGYVRTKEAEGEAEVYESMREYDAGISLEVVRMSVAIAGRLVRRGRVRGAGGREPGAAGDEAGVARGEAAGRAGEWQATRGARPGHEGAWSRGGDE